MKIVDFRRRCPNHTAAHMPVSRMRKGRRLVTNRSSFRPCVVWSPSQAWGVERESDTLVFHSGGTHHGCVRAN